MIYLLKVLVWKVKSMINSEKISISSLQISLFLMKKTTKDQLFNLDQEIIKLFQIFSYLEKELINVCKTLISISKIPKS